MDPVERQLERLNNEFEKLTAKTDAAWDAYLSATDPQQKVELKERYETLDKQLQDSRSDRLELQRMLPSSGEPTA